MLRAPTQLLVFALVALVGCATTPKLDPDTVAAGMKFSDHCDGIGNVATAEIASVLRYYHEPRAGVSQAKIEEISAIYSNAPMYRGLVISAGLSYSNLLCTPTTTSADLASASNTLQSATARYVALAALARRLTNQ